MRRDIRAITVASLLVVGVAMAPRAAASSAAAAPAVWRPGAFYLRDSPTTGIADHVTAYGDPAQGETPLLCDFDGSGIKRPVVVRGTRWFVRLAPGDGPADHVFTYGNPGDIPACGDWDGDGVQSPGVVRRFADAPDSNPFFAIFFMAKSLDDLTDFSAYRFYSLGDPYDPVVLDESLRPAVGRWNQGFAGELPGIAQDGVFEVATKVVCSGRDCGGPVFYFGDPGDVPVVGDWNGDGITDLGVVRNGEWFLKYLDPAPPSWNLESQRWLGPADAAFAFGDPGDVPLAH